MRDDGSSPPYGTWLLALASVVGLVASSMYFFSPGDGIAGTAGVILVMVTLALMVLASLAMAIWPAMARWLRGLLLFLILLDIVGTGFAGYMLEAWWIVGAMAVALVAWIIHVAADPAPRRVTVTA